MKKLSARVRNSLKPHKEEDDEVEADSILVSPANNNGIDTTNLSRSLANFLTRPIDTFGSRGSLHRKKDKNASLFASWKSNGSSSSSSSSLRSSLPPPMPPQAPAPKLRRVNSSTISLGGNRKKMLTMDELYEESLYTVLHMIGCDAEREEQKRLIAHLRATFDVSPEKHEQLLDVARMREEPCLKANLDIFEAKDLIGKDMSGSSDPFCTFYLTTNPLTRFNSSYKERTLNPVWNEEFVLNVNSVENDCLRIDVWDFNPEENVSDKFRKLNEVKDGRGLRKFIKETLIATTGKISHGLIGSVEIPLREVPASGMERWVPLEKPEAKTRRQRGQLRVAIALSTEKDQNLTAQEHKNLLKILLAHELVQCEASAFTWRGDMSKEAATILAQHAVQGKLTGAETALCRWLVYVHTHIDLPLHYSVFIPVLDKISYAIKNGLFHQEDETKFIENAAVFSHHCFEFIRDHKNIVAADSGQLVQVECILRSLKLIADSVEGREAPPNDEKLEISDYYHLVKLTSRGNMALEVEAAVSESFDRWYASLMAGVASDDQNDSSLKSITRLVQFIVGDLKQGCAIEHGLFKDILGIDYLKLAFEMYEAKVTLLSRARIEATCDTLRPIIFTESEESDEEHEAIAVGTSLFELYLALQQMANFGLELYGAPSASEFMSNHLWFNKAISRWLDIALYKAMQRISRAVDLDEMAPVDDLVRHSSSAVDIKTVLLQIKTFWKQLSWPDVEASYAYISKILDDVCKTSIFYADQMCKRVVSAQQRDSATFVVTPAMCLAINNIDYVLAYIRPFVEELGLESTLEKLKILNGEMVANSCRRTLTTLVHNAVENVENKIFEVLDMVGEKMAPVIQKFLVEGSSLVAYAGRDKETLIQYLDNNMIILKEQLNESNFEKILSVIWECSAQSLSEIIHLSIERQKPPSYFRMLLDILKILINFFYGERLPQDETLLKMQNLLKLYASDSEALIARYLSERHLEQKGVRSGEFVLGSVTVRCQRLSHHLRVEILNARQLKPPDPQAVRISSKPLSIAASRRRRSSANLSRSARNLDWVKSKFASINSNLHEAGMQLHHATSAGTCHPYVSLRIVPETAFPALPKFRTKTHKRTLFPLFDETFDFVLSPSTSSSLHDGYLQLVVKDRGVMGNCIFLGEALIAMRDLPVSDGNKRLADLPQVQIPLTKPSLQDSDIVFALESRHFDRAAKQFLQKERRKL